MNNATKRYMEHHEARIQSIDLEIEALEEEYADIVTESPTGKLNRILRQCHTIRRDAYAAAVKQMGEIE